MGGRKKLTVTDNKYKKFCKWWSIKKIFILLAIVSIIILLPILYCSFFDYATGDDLAYSAGLHHAMQQGASLFTALQVMCKEVADTYQSYQGTWSSVFLFQLQPGVWGERVYTLTVWISLFFLLFGTWYFFSDMLKRFHISKYGSAVIFLITAFLSVQYMPKVRGGIFWHTSIVHYVVPYGIALFCAVWSAKWIDTGKKRYLIFLILCMSYLGGAGYPPIVLATVLTMLLLLGTVTGLLPNSHDRISKKRACMLLIPLALLLIGFAVSAAAPGNKVRGGSDFGFSLSRVFGTIGYALILNVKDGFEYLVTDRLLALCILLIAIIAWETFDVEKIDTGSSHPLIFVILAFLVSASVRTPRIYAAVGVSGGVPDVEYFTSVLCLVAAVCCIMVSLKKRAYRKGRKLAADQDLFNQKIRTPYMIFLILFCIVFSRHLVGNTVDYTCVTFITSGQLADFQDQMEERLAILYDDSIKDVVLPEMNSEQGPFMHMAITDDPNNFTNSATADYYNKNSVIAIPREEYEKIHNNTNTNIDQ